MQLFRRWALWANNGDTEIPVRPSDADENANLILSFPKSGRTWLSYLYAYYACYRVIGDDADAFIDRELTPTAHIYRPLEHPALLSRLQGHVGLIPTVRLGHYFEPTPYFQLDVALGKIGGRRVAFLARDPRDVVVSYFHHTMRRASETKVKRRPMPAADVDLSEFIRSETHGIRAIVAYMNQVSERGPHVFDEFRIWHYEDMVARPEQLFRGILEFFRASVDDWAVRSAIQRASFANLQQLEIQRRTQKGGVPPSVDSLRFRRGVPGTYRTELAESDAMYLDKVLARHLSPAFGRYRMDADCLA